MIKNILSAAQGAPSHQAAQHGALLVGAAKPLGEKCLQYVLTQSYQQVWVETLAPLPASIDKLAAWAGQAEVDCLDIILVVDDTPPPRSIFGQRGERLAIYSELRSAAVQEKLQHCLQAVGSVVSVRVLIIAAEVPMSHAQHWLPSAGTENLETQVLYAQLDSQWAAQHSPFAAQGNSWLDRLGLWLLNTVRQLVINLMASNEATPWAQQLPKVLLQRLNQSHAQGMRQVLLTAADLQG